MLDISLDDKLNRYKGDDAAFVRGDLKVDYQEEFKQAVETFFEAYAVLSKLRENTWIEPSLRDIMYSIEARNDVLKWALPGTSEELNPLLRKVAQEAHYYGYLMGQKAE